MNYAVESGEGRVDYMPGSPWNNTAKEAERAWRKAKGIQFLPVTVRPTTAEEDRQLPNPEACATGLGRK